MKRIVSPCFAPVGPKLYSSTFPALGSPSFLVQENTNKRVSSAQQNAGSLKKDSLIILQIIAVKSLFGNLRHDSEIIEADIGIQVTRSLHQQHGPVSIWIDCWLHRIAIKYFFIRNHYSLPLSMGIVGRFPLVIGLVLRTGSCIDTDHSIVVRFDGVYFKLQIIILRIENGIIRNIFAVIRHRI